MLKKQHGIFLYNRTTGDMLLKKRLTLKAPNASPNLKADLLLSAFRNFPEYIFIQAQKGHSKAKNIRAPTAKCLPKSETLLGRHFIFY